jgi:flagellar secretion chaperone FliS
LELTLPTDLRSRFTDTMLSTAPQGRLVTLVYDRLIRDLRQARAAVVAGALGDVHTALVHAQDLLLVLDLALDETVWPTAKELHRLYEYVGSRMVAANVSKTTGPLDECLAVLEPLATAWHEAYRLSASAESPS